ncbi:hypothetical protein ACFLTQ_00165 [Chloroflexota bacterium]
MANIDALVPDLNFSESQYRRFCHLDICQMEDTELGDEFYALRPLLWGLPSDHWLRERVAELKAEIMKRRGSTGYKFKAWPKPRLAEGIEL